LKQSGRLDEKLVRTLLVALLLACLSPWPNAVRAADGSNSPAGLVVYSDINFIEAEGEFVGLQVAIVPYGEHDEKKLLWRTAGPFPESPLLLDVVQVGATLKVVVPDREGDEFAGVWNFNLKKDVLYAVGPQGRKYTLKKISLK
jgi:hypothetical protein